MSHREASPALRDLPPEERAREICLRALERRRHSRWELERRLREKRIPDDVAARVLDRLAEVGLVDDYEFARAYVASRQRRRPRGARALVSELGARGVARAVVERVLGEREENPEEEAERALRPRLRALRSLPPAEGRRKAANFLQRRGFSYETIRAVLDRVLDDAADDEA